MGSAAVLVTAAAILMQGFDRPTELTRSTRSMVIATQGMVATSQPLAAQAGLAILQRGGNAFDAAVATAAVLNVVEPMSTGIGGDMFAIAWVASARELVGINGSGRSSRRASLEHFRSKGYRVIPIHGADSVTVPGAVDGWFELHSRHGRLPMREVLAPAIEYAERGFPVTEIIASAWRAAESSADDEAFASAYLVEDGDGHRAPRLGEIFRQPGLGRTFRVLAEKGRDAFYRGEIAERIAACLRERGSLIDAADLAAHRSTWVDTVSTTFHGYEVHQLPPNGQGITVLEMLNILEGYDLKRLGHNSAAYLHLIVEAKKFAFADRDRFVADPEGDLPVETLISKEYAARVRERIDPRRASRQPRSVLAAGSDTIYLTVADREGNLVSFINSIFHGFGSRIVVPGTGIILQNRGALFSLDTEHPNCIGPSKLPFHTIIPGFVLRDGKPYMSFGVMGGNFQPQGQVQVLLNHILFGMNPQEAGERARVAEDDGVVTVESGVPAEVVENLRALGHTVRTSGGYYGGYQAILVDPVTGAYHGGSDNRKDGAVVGF